MEIYKAEEDLLNQLFLFSSTEVVENKLQLSITQSNASLSPTRLVFSMTHSIA